MAAPRKSSTASDTAPTELSSSRRGKSTAQQETPRAGQPRRTKKQTKWATVSVRVHAHLDDRVAYACDVTGLGPKGVVEAAINDYADALGVPTEFKENDPGLTEQMPHDWSNRRNRRPNGTGEDPDLVMISVRVVPLSRTRLWHSCDFSGQGAQTTVVTALNLYLRKLGVPQNVHRDAAGNLIAG